MSADKAQSPPRAIPVAVVPLLVVAVLGLVAVGLKVLHPDRTLPVLVRAVAPGHRITAGDLARQPASVSGFGLGDVADAADEIEGHVAQVGLKAGKPIAPDQLTADAVPADYGTRRLLRLRTEKATMVGVRSGDKVALMLAPVHAGLVPGPAVICAVLIDATKDGDDDILLIAVRSHDVPKLLTRVGRSRLILTAP